MRVIETDLPGVRIVEPGVFGDERGYFLETYHQERYARHGMGFQFVQDNLSFSRQGVLRGLHYQFPNAQAKLVQVIRGRIFDVAVDIRRRSPTFGVWTGAFLSEENKRQMIVPEGFAHGFCVVSDTALVMYKCSAFYAPEMEKGILWSDPGLAIDWPAETPIVSDKDRRNPMLRDVPFRDLPEYGT